MHLAEELPCSLILRMLEYFSFGVPSSTTCPLSRKITVRHMADKVHLMETRALYILCRNFLITSRTSPTSSGSRAEVVQLVSSRICGFMARLCERHLCCCPPTYVSEIMVCPFLHADQFSSSNAMALASSFSSLDDNQAFHHSTVLRFSSRQIGTAGTPFLCSVLNTEALSVSARKGRSPCPDRRRSFSGVSRRLTQRRSVDFPVPEGLMIPTTSPCLISRLMSSGTTLSLYF